MLQCSIVDLLFHISFVTSWPEANCVCEIELGLPQRRKSRRASEPRRLRVKS